MKNRILIMTGGASINRPLEETDNTIEEILDATLPSKQRYAKKYGYDLLSIRSFGSDKKNRFKDFQVGFLRALRAFEMLNYYDVVMWLDADSIITNDEYSINDFLLDDEHVFYASYDWFGKTSFSAGNFIVKNTKDTEEFLNVFFNVCKYFPEEQATLNTMYFSSYLSNKFKILDHKYLGSIPTLEMYKNWFKPLRPIVGTWEEGAFLAHIAGSCNAGRLEILNNYFKKYL
jgi:hypothetical protein